MVSNNCLQLLHMAKRFIWLEETGERINEFYIGYMINTNLYVNKAFRDQVEKCMNTTFGALAQPFINTTFSKKYKCFRIVNFSLENRSKA